MTRKDVREMNGRERVIAAIRKEPLTEIPSSFSLHFPEGCENGEESVKAHLEFFEKTGTDIYKIMNENLMPACDGVRCGDDWKLIPKFSRNDAWLTKQIDLTKRILDRCEPGHFTMGTLHGVVASSLHLIEKRYGYDGGRLAQPEHLRQNKVAVADVYKRIADILCVLAEEYIKAGLDSVYYAALGGEYRYYTDEEFETFIAPLDKQVMTAIRESGGYCVLHICKDRLNMRRYQSYNDYADIVNWGIYEAPFSLEEGKKLFPGTAIMGGLANRSGVLVEGTKEEIEDRVRQIIEENGKTGFILGADCTIPTEIEYWRVRAAAEAARK